MSRALVTIHSRSDRETIARWAMGVSTGTRVEFKAPRRTLDQNALMWAMLTDVATQVRWHGLKLTADDWKLIFLDALKREVRIVPNIDSTGFVNLGRSSSDLGKQEMSDLIEIIMMFGANHGVNFKDTNPPLPSAEKAPAGPHKVSPDPVTSTAGADQSADDDPATRRLDDLGSVQDGRKMSTDGQQGGGLDRHHGTPQALGVTAGETAPLSSSTGATGKAPADGGEDGPGIGPAEHETGNGPSSPSIVGRRLIREKDSE